MRASAIWAAAVESSVVVRLLRAVNPDRALTAAVLRGGPRFAWLARDVQASGRPTDNRRAIELLNASAAVRAVEAVAARLRDDWCRSRSAAWWAAASGWVASLGTRDRLRLASSTLLVAVVVHLVATQFDAPAPVRGTRVVWIGLLMIAGSVCAGADALVRAWKDWSGNA